MASTKSSKKPATSAPGVKLLLTATSLAATLGGWALISGSTTKPVASATPSLASAPATAPANEQAAASTITINLAPLPTLVPEITLQSQVVPVNQPRPIAVQQSAVPQPPASQPTQTTLVLRDVSAPAVHSGGSAVAGSASAPAPVVNTKSSR